MTLNIALWSARTLDNFGDRLIAEINERELTQRLPQARFQHYCPWSKGGRDTWRLFIDLDGRWSGIGMYDAIVVVGGGVLGGPPFKHPIMQVFCFGPDPAGFEPGVFLAWNAIGLQDGSLEPERPHWRAYLDSVRKRLQYCTVRSEDTATRVAGNDEIGRPLVVPDPSFALPPSTGKLHVQQGKYRLGVALGNPFPTVEFLSTIAGPELINRCPFNSATCLAPEEVLLHDFSQTEVHRKKGFLPAILHALSSLREEVTIEFFGFGKMYADQDLAMRLAGTIVGSRVVSAANQDVDTMQALISSYDGLILSRYHASILALRAGRPFIAADPYWCPWTGTSKLHQLMVSTGLKHAYWTYETNNVVGSADPTAIISAMLHGEVKNEGIYFDLHRQCRRNFDDLAASLKGGIP